MGLVTSVFVSQMAFHLRPSPMQVAMQMGPQPLYTHFILLALVIFVLSAFLVVIRSVVISRILPFYLIPASIALFLMIQTTVTPVVDFRATDYLITHIPQKLLAGEPYRIVCWQSNEERDGLYSRMLMSDASVIQSVYSMTALDRLLARRHPLLFMVIPESQYFAIPDEIRSQGGSIMATSWRWRVSLSVPLMVAAFSNETLDFHTLTEPVILVRIPPRGL
jgi:hypothetical protein